VAAAGLVLSLAPAAPARATHTVTDFTLTVASPQAGASVNASSSTSLSYANATEDVKKTIGHFAAGMIANPEAVPHCPQAMYLADACPADTRIGEAEAVVSTFPATLPVVEKGRIYNQELLGSEAGRLGIIVDSPTGKLFLTAPFFVRTNGDFGLDGILDDIPRLTPATQITKLSFTLYGTVNGRNYTRAPTSCSRKTSTGEAYGYEHNEPVSGPSSSYTPTGCDKLPFKPTFAISAGDRRSNRLNRHPPLHVTVTQKPGEAGVLGNTVTLPRQLTPNTAAITALCNDGQLAAGTCPPASQVGTATATSPFLATPLAGPVWLAQQPGQVLPALVADLRGRVPIKIRIGTSFVGGKQIKSTVAGVPDLPIGSFNLSLNGGPKGVLTNKANLCLTSRARFRRLKAAITFDAHSGAKTNSTPRIKVAGCAPRARATLRRAASARPRLRIRVRRHPDAKKIKRLQVRLPKGLRFVRAKVGGKGAVKRRGRIFATSFRKSGVKGATIRFRRGALKIKPGLRKRARRGSKRKLTFKITTVDTAGQRSVSKARARAKRR
jgi:hypothetical protein